MSLLEPLRAEVVFFRGVAFLLSFRRPVHNLRSRVIYHRSILSYPRQLENGTSSLIEIFQWGSLTWLLRHSGFSCKSIDLDEMNAMREYARLHDYTCKHVIERALLGHKL